LGWAGAWRPRQWPTLFNVGQAETVARWIDALPRESAEADPRVCLARAWAALQPGVVEEMESWLRAAELAPQPESSPGTDVVTSVEGSAALLRQTSALMVGDDAGSQAAGNRALALYPEAADPRRAVANINLGQTYYFAGDLAGAEAALRNGLQRLPGAGWSLMHVIGLGQLALARLDQGDVDDAEAIMAEAERHIAAGRVDEASATSPAAPARGGAPGVDGGLARAAG